MNLHFNNIMFFIENATNEYQEKRTEHLLIERTGNRIQRFRLRKQAIEGRNGFTYENVCGKFKYVDSINFMTRSEKLENNPPEEIANLTCSEFFASKSLQRKRKGSVVPTDGKTPETVFKRSKASFLDSSSFE